MDKLRRRKEHSSSKIVFSPTTLLLRFFKKVLEISEGFWFIPTLFMFALSTSAVLFIQIDANIGNSESFIIRWTGNLEPDSAKGLMQVIATSVITITSIAFSITLVVLTMASQQFGPRLIGNFIKDKRTQCVLGIFTSTFVYCLIVLRSIKTDFSAPFVPEISVSFGMLLAVFCVFTLIYFIHHVAISIQADNVIQSVSHSIKSDFEEMTSMQSTHLNKGRELLNVEHFTYQRPLCLRMAGYIQGINYQGLSDLAKRYNGLIELDVRAGHHVLGAIPIATFYSDAQADSGLDVSTCLIIGDARTPLQDPEFSVNQLVEMALRALSPSINDPFTAIHCIDSLSRNLASLVEKDISRGFIVDDDDAVRVITRLPTFDGLLACAFNQIRQNGLEHVAVMIALLSALADLLYLSKPQRTNKISLIKQVRAIEEELESSDMSLIERQSLNQSLRNCYAFCDEELLRESQLKRD